MHLFWRMHAWIQVHTWHIWWRTYVLIDIEVYGTSVCFIWSRFLTVVSTILRDCFLLPYALCNQTDHAKRRIQTGFLKHEYEDRQIKSWWKYGVLCTEVEWPWFGWSCFTESRQCWREWAWCAAQSAISLFLFQVVLNIFASLFDQLHANMDHVCVV